MLNKSHHHTLNNPQGSYSAMADSIEVISILCEVKEVKIYNGLSELHALMHDRLCRERLPIQWSHAPYYTSEDYSGKKLGHVEKKVQMYYCMYQPAKLVRH